MSSHHLGFVGGAWGECPACGIGCLEAGVTAPPDDVYDSMIEDDSEEWYAAHSYWECIHCGWRSDE